MDLLSPVGGSVRPVVDVSAGIVVFCEEGTFCFRNCFG